MSARSETLEGIDPEERAWLASYLDVFARKYAHELAEKIRADARLHEDEDDCCRKYGLALAGSIDPKKEGQ